MENKHLWKFQDHQKMIDYSIRKFCILKYYLFFK